MIRKHALLLPLVAGLLVSGAARSDDARTSDLGLVPVTTLARLKLPEELDHRQQPLSLFGAPLPDIGIRKSKDGPRFQTKNGACLRNLSGIDGADVLTTYSFGDRIPARIERIVRSGENARLDVFDGWLERSGTSLQSELVRMNSVSLQPIARGPLDLVAYAYREGDHVIVLAQRPYQDDKEDYPTCPVMMLPLDTKAKDGSESRVLVHLEQKKAVWLSASVTRLASSNDILVSASFGRLKN
jgi:hypothetical protein